MRVVALPTPVEIDLQQLDVSSADPRRLPQGPLLRERVRPAREAEPTLAAESSPLSQIRTAQKARLAGLDAARLLATFGIVLTHVAEAQGLPSGVGTLGRFGTSFYVIAAALFVVRSAQRPQARTWAEDTKHRATRILLPFVTWSLLYGLYYGSLGLSAGHSVKGITFWWGPVAGTAIHLWFLPFVFFWGAVATWLTPKLLRLKAMPLLGITIFGGSLLYYASYAHVFFAVDRPWLWRFSLHRLDRWIVEVPLFLTAVFAFVTLSRMGDKQRALVQAAVPTITLAAVAAFLTSQYLYGTHIEFIRDATHTEGRFMANVAGLSLLIVAVNLPSLSQKAGQMLSALAPVGQYTYLAFLSHMFVLELLRAPLSRLPGYGSVATMLLSTCIVFLGSLAVAKLIASTRWLKWLRP